MPPISEEISGDDTSAVRPSRTPDGRGFHVMKLVRGERLDLWAKGRELRERLRLFRRICEAVAFAHAHEVLHRDLKPQNVMVGAFGEALVMDWGLARSLSDATEAAGTIVGTPAYMAPEQAKGAAVDSRTDVYGLGAILDSLLESAPPPLTSICKKAMAAVPADRYANATELGDDVGRFLEQEPVIAHPESLLERLTCWSFCCCCWSQGDPALPLLAPAGRGLG